MSTRTRPTGYGEGSIYQRQDGRWVAAFSHDGKRISCYGTTEAQAKTKRKAAIKRLHQGKPATASRQTFATEAARWEETYSRALRISEPTRRNYLDVLRLHVLPLIGAKRIEDVRPSDITAVMVAMTDKGFSPSYRHQAHKAISHVYRMLLADELVTVNPCRAVPAPRGTVRQPVVPDRDLVLAMIDAATDERLRTYLVIAAHTGLRISEVLDLTWGDVNYDTATITVRSGKGGKARAAYLTPTCAAQLRAWRTTQAAQRLAAPWWSEGDWIITTDIGTRMDAHNFRRLHFNPLRNKVAPGVTPHSLRHAFATLMLEEGVPMRVVADQLGHTSTRITEQTYSHVTARLQAEAGAAVERALGGR